MSNVTRDGSTTSAELQRELESLRAENNRLRGLLGLNDPSRLDPIAPWEPTLFQDPTSRAELSTVNRSSPSEAKIALFRELFAGRDDVYALRWENQRTGKSGWGPAIVGGWANARKPGREYASFTPEVVEAHLVGGSHAGVYPLLRDDRCRQLVCDFDGPGWALDALAYVDAARDAGIPMALERSRSGDGAHVWAFFSGRVPASAARLVGVYLLREAMTIRAELDLASYDRLFPTQDFMPKGSFGNLIALPLQGACRKRGTTVFLDPATLEPYDDQWAFLSTQTRSSPEAITSFAESLRPVAAGPDETTYKRAGMSVPQPKPPETIRATSGSMLAVERIGIPPALLSALKHLASLHNPAYYEKERLRFSTWNTPRFLRCYRETIDQLLLPRGVTEQAERIVVEAGSRLVVSRGCGEPSPTEFRLRTQLTDRQHDAVEALIPHELGVLVASPGAGKTVIACGAIAQHQVPTLIIVDRQPLVEQWRERLIQHLGVDRKEVGQLGAGRKRTIGVIDIGMVQSLARRDDLPDLTSRYGFVVVDECHHVPAVTFERCVRQIPVTRWLGLTATPYRRDGLQGLISMYCGPIRHRMGSRTSEAPTLQLDLVVHPTDHATPDAEDLRIQDVFRGIVENDQRNEQIGADVAHAVEAGRNCLVLSQWTAHIDRLVACFRARGHEPLVLQGGMGKRARAQVVEQLERSDREGGILLIATGSFLGEGFDCPPLDTLFLTFPLAFKGRLVQYVGRVLRQTETKSRVEVHDYVDVDVPVLVRMHAKRLAAYAELGFDVGRARTGAGGRRTPRSSSRSAVVAPGEFRL
jgi:superfamily II DNA or RNA helicase